jgi:hypothetical protein
LYNPCFIFSSSAAGIRHSKTCFAIRANNFSVNPPNLFSVYQIVSFLLVCKVTTDRRERDANCDVALVNNSLHTSVCIAGFGRIVIGKQLGFWVMSKFQEIGSDFANNWKHI